MRYEQLNINDLTVNRCNLHGVGDLGIGEKVYVDVTYGSNGNSGKTADTALKTIVAAESVLATGRNDTLLLLPGAYPVTEEIAWDKNNTHIIGLGGPNTKADYSEPNVAIYTVTAAINYTINLTGNNCQFINVGINNGGNGATNLAAMLVNSYGNWFENVTFIGNLAANQLSAVAAGSLAIYTNGHNNRFVDCIIGEDCWGARTGVRSGQLIFNGSQPNGVRFTRCNFRSQSSTATVAMVRITPIGVGRDCVFDDCHFNNYGTSNLNQCFASSVNDTTHSWTQIILKNTHSHGIDRWTDHSVDYIYGTMPVADDGGGQSIALDETVAGGA